VVLPGRFESSTPIWRVYFGRHILYNTDSPSAFGYWPFVRAAAKSGGSYIFYPFPPAKFHDICPYDPMLLRRLAPETTSRAGFVKAKAGDHAIQALCEASRLVQDATPWSDGLGRASGWLGFASTRPLALEKRFRNRSKPHDWADVGAGTPDAIVSARKRLAGVPALYDRAIAILDRAERDIRDGKVPRPHRRSMANLRLARFWFEMSAFHLAALSLYMIEIEEHLPPDVRDGGGEIYIAYAEAIRLSDCLSGYEGRSISLERDLALARPAAGRWAGAQDNFLSLAPSNPDYRALRHLGQVLKNLDPRLKGRALRMISAAEEVMAHEGRSPWGWMVYYSEACTFVYFTAEVDVGPGERPGKEAEGATTPRVRPRPGGGTSTGK
jgi:hypothetical protein